MIPETFPAAAKEALLQIYSSIYNEKGMTIEALAENIRIDLAYFQIKPATTREEVIAYMAGKYEANEKAFAYAVDPQMTTRSYRLRRALTETFYILGEVLMKPVRLIHNHLSAISLTLFTAGTLRTFGARILGWIR